MEDGTRNQERKLTQEKDYQAAHEIGKIFNSTVDKKVLCAFFLQSVSLFIEVAQAALYLKGKDGEVWREAVLNEPWDEKDAAMALVSEVFEQGKARRETACLLLPLIVKDEVIGVGYFIRENGRPAFSHDEEMLASGLAVQASSALKSLLLFDENLQMEKLATVGETVSIVMHEVKNILQVAKLSVEILRRGMQDKKEKFIEHGIDGINKAVRDLESFAWDMLSLTKEYQIESKEVSLADVLDELRKDLAPRALQHNVELDFKVDSGLVTVRADSRSLYRALLNLVQNCIEACDKETAFVRVHIYPVDAENFEIHIQDNGMGMSPEVKAKLFQGFMTTKGRKGNGLGMLIVQRTVKSHQGSIRVESEAGKGTSFFLRLPRKTA